MTDAQIRLYRFLVTMKRMTETEHEQLPQPNKTEILEANVLNLQKLCIGLQKQIILK